MKKFRIKNLTVAVDVTKETRFGCGINYSCPGGPAGSLCGGFVTNDYCGFRSINCYNTPNCFAATQNCMQFTRDCLVVTQDVCGINFSTIQPIDITQIVRAVEPVERGGLVSALKVDLNLALEQLELTEKQLQSDLIPQNIEDINDLETNLEGALKEVKEMKKKFKNNV